MRKRLALVLFGGLLAAMLLLSACDGSNSEKMTEYKELGISQMESGDYESAAQSFQKALDQSLGRIGAEELDICYYKALALYKSGDTTGAIEAYTALIEYDKKNWEAWYLRGNVYLQEGQDTEALEDYAQAVLLNDSVELCAHIYENLADAGLAESGQDYINRVLSITPSTADEYYYVGEIYFLTENADSAKENLLQAQELGYDKALLLLGYIYSDEGDSEAAEAAFASYMELYPEDAEALNELGAIALAAGEYANAVTYLETALNAADESLEMSVLKNLIIAYEYSGDFESAYNMAVRFLRSYSDEEIEREYEFLATRVGGDVEAADSAAEEDSSDGTESGDEAADSSESETES
ncbi:MAG: tetratricopeptide repeat protein [Clostridiales bacterium]|nr:tetratricopeptide repeat protein [Clostridiales bacterium]